MKNPLLEVRDLSIHFFTEEGVVRAVENVSLEIYPRRSWVSWANRDVEKV